MSDVDALYKAMKGFGTDEDTLIKIVANRTSSQRQKIKKDYIATYGKDLIEELKEDLNGKMEDAMLALFKDPVEYDVDALYKAMHGLGTDEDTLIEIIVSRSTGRMKEIIDLYKKKYGETLEKKVTSETSGTLRKLLVSILQCQRSENTKPDVAKCKAVAKEIYEAGEAKKGTDEAVFNKYFTSMSPYELAYMAQAYHQSYGKTILDAIDKEFSGDSKKALRTIVYATISPSEYFATRVQEAIKGWGTDDSLLMRVLITRDEIDMDKIKTYYKQLYKKDMVDAVKSELSGDYKKLMIELCSH